MRPTNATSASVAVTTGADLTVVKTASPSSVVAGQSVTWTIVASNAGPSFARAVRIADAWPPGIANAVATTAVGTCIVTSVVDCDLLDLAPGTNAAVTVTADVLANFVASTLNNTASVSSTTPDPNSANTSTATTRHVHRQTLSVLKSGPSAVVAGTPITWTITVANAGPSDAQLVSLDDVPPLGVNHVVVTATQGGCSGTLHCLLSTVRPGTPVVVTLTGDVDPSYSSATLVNVATVSSATSDPAANDHTSQSTTNVTASSDLQLTKVAATSPVIPGKPAVWVLSVKNVGPSTATSVILTESLPSGIHDVTFTPGQGTCTVGGVCSLGELDPGRTAVVTVAAVVDADRTGSIANSASVSSTTPLTNPSDDSRTLVTPLVSQADVSITKTGPTGVVVPGSAVTWNIVVANPGPSVVHGVVVTDVLPTVLLPGSTVATTNGTCTISAGTLTCTLDPMNPSTSVTITVSGTVDPSTVSPTLSNTATVSSPDDVTPGNNSSNASNPTSPSADLSVIVTPSSLTVVAGMPLDFTITVTNKGVSDAADTSLTFVVPPGYALTNIPGCTIASGIATCAIGTLAPGATRTYTLTGIVGPGYLGTTMTLTAAATTTTVDSDPTNNDGAAAVASSGNAALSLSKIASVANATFGDTISFTLTLSNGGPSVAPSSKLPVSGADSMRLSLIAAMAVVVGSALVAADRRWRRYRSHHV